MPPSSPRASVWTEQQRAWAARFASGLFALCLALTTIFAVVWLGGSNTTVGLVTGSLIGATLVCLTAWMAVRQQHLGFGLTLLFLLSWSYPNLYLWFYDGNGLAWGLASFTLSLLLAMLTLRDLAFNRLIIINTLLMLVPYFVDTFALSGSRLIPPPAFETVSWAILVGCAGLTLLVFVRQFNLYSLRAKLILGFLGVALLPIFVLGAINLYQTQITLAEANRARLYNLAVLNAQALDAIISSNTDNIRAEAQLPVFMDYLTRPAAARADSVTEAQALATLQALRRKSHIYIISYALFDHTGENVLDTDPTEIGLNRSGRDYFVGPFETQAPYISNVEIASNTNELSFYISALVRDINDTPVGVLRMKINAALLQQALQQQESAVQEGIYAVLWDQDHIRLAHSTNPALIAKSAVPLPVETVRTLQLAQRLPNRPLNELATNLPDLERSLQNHQTQNLVAELESDPTERAVGGIATLELQNWTVTVLQPERVLNATIEQQIRVNVFFGFGVAAMVVVVAVSFAQIFARPLRELATVATRFSTGDLQVRAPQQGTDEIGLLAKAFNQMAAQLQLTVTDLEQRVADRTHALATSAAVSRRISTILDPQVLATNVVNQLQEAFGYYHAHIFLYDEATQSLRLAGGTGEAGRAMLARQHTIPLGRGVVGRAAQRQQPLLVPEVQADPEWLPNRLLPETRAELAVPIVLGQQLLGVLDVQRDEVNSLTAEDSTVLQAVADQLAVALQNARLYRQTQRQAERRALAVKISQQVQTARTPEELTQIVARELGQGLGARQTHVTLNNPQRPLER